MILNLGQVISRASEMAGGRKDWTQSDISFYVNLAYTEVCGRARFRGTESIAIQSTDTGENKYNLPTDFDYEKVVRMEWPSTSSTTAPSTNSNQCVLMKKNQLQLEQMAWGSNQSYNTPQFYGIYGNALQIWPTPASMMSIFMHYQSKPVTLMESTETLAIDDRFHIAVLYRSVALLEGSRGDAAAESMANARYVQYVSGQPNMDALNQQARYGAAASFPREYFGNNSGRGGVW